MVSCEKVNSVLGDVGKGENKAKISVCKDPPCSYFVLILQGIDVLGKFQKRAVRVIRTRKEKIKLFSLGSW